MSDNYDTFSTRSALLVKTQNVDQIMEKENRQDMKQLGQDTSKIKDVMMNINGLIEDGGQQISDISDEIENAADMSDNAFNELKKAQEHQKCCVHLKCFFIIGGIVLAIILLMVLLGVLGVFKN